MFLTDDGILQKIKDEGMIRDYGSLDDQLQPNGFDFRVNEVKEIQGGGVVQEFDKILPLATTIGSNNEGYWHLTQGAYQVTFSETVKIPTNILGLGRPRSTLCRSGVSLHTGVWDAGYEGRSTALLVVHTPTFTLQRQARIMQMIFGILNGAPSALYNGSYQKENLRQPTYITVDNINAYGRDPQELAVALADGIADTWDYPSM